MSAGDFYVDIECPLAWAGTQLATYADQGLTVAQLAGLAARNVAYRVALGRQRQAIRARTLATAARQQAYNALNDELTALCGMGKAMFGPSSTSQYDDYVLDPAPSAGGRRCRWRPQHPRRWWPGCRRRP